MTPRPARPQTRFRSQLLPTRIYISSESGTLKIRSTRFHFTTSPRVHLAAWFFSFLPQQLSTISYTTECTDWIKKPLKPLSPAVLLHTSVVYIVQCTIKLIEHGEIFYESPRVLDPDFFFITAVFLFDEILSTNGSTNESNTCSCHFNLLLLRAYWRVFPIPRAFQPPTTIISDSPPFGSTKSVITMKNF